MKLSLTTFASALVSLLCLDTTSAFAPALSRPSLVSNTRLFDSGFADAALAVSEAAGSLRGQIVVVKYGGNAMTSPELALGFCQDVAALQNLGIRVVVVHGTCQFVKALFKK